MQSLNRSEVHSIILICSVTTTAARVCTTVIHADNYTAGYGQQPSMLTAILQGMDNSHPCWQLYCRVWTSHPHWQLLQGLLVHAHSSTLSANFTFLCFAIRKV